MAQRLGLPAAVFHFMVLSCTSHSLSVTAEFVDSIASEGHGRARMFL